jgi:hypothetical protein
VSVINKEILRYQFVRGGETNNHPKIPPDIVADFRRAKGSLAALCGSLRSNEAGAKEK